MQDSSLSLPKELDRFRSKLLDLSLRNPLLNYRISKRKTILIGDEQSDDVFRKLVQQEKTLILLPDPEMDGGVMPETLATSSPDAIRPTSHSNNSQTEARSQRAVRRRLENQLQTAIGTTKFQPIARAMARDAKTSIEETGINYLHLAIGFLRWHENETIASELRMAPLILVPVTIQSTLSPNGGYEFSLAWNGDDVQFNASLRKKLESDFAISIPEFQEEQTPAEYFAQVKTAIQSKQRWNVEEKMLLGFFSFHKLSMYMDIDPEKWKDTAALSESSLATRLISGGEQSGSGLYAEEYDVDNHEVAKKIGLPLDADSSQQSAITDIAQGKSLVIEGPPGTGKSQTIANAIAHAIEQGKSILFVAEKMAALEVVHKRLAQAGLSEFCLELHGHSVAPKRVMESLASRIAGEPHATAQNGDNQRRLEECKGKLRDYLRASSKLVGPYNEPLYALFWRIVKLRQDGVPIRRDIPCDSGINLDTFENACEALDAFSQHSANFENPTESAWWGYFPKELAPTEASRILGEISKLDEQAKTMTEAVSQLHPIFGEDDSRLTAFLSHNDPKTLELLAETAPLSPVLPFEKLSEPKLRERIERFEAAHRREKETLAKLTHDLIDLPQDVAAVCQKLDAETLSQLKRWSTEIRYEQLVAIQSWAAQTRTLIALHQNRVKAWKQLGFEETSRILDIDRAIQTVHLLQHPIAVDKESIGADWFLDSFRTSLGRIKTQQDSLVKRREDLAMLFHLPSVPEREGLVDLIKRLRASGGSWLSWLNGDYRRASKELRSFSRFPSSYTFGKRMMALESLEGFTREVNAFQSDPANQRMLGPLFQGLETNWDSIKMFFSWVATAKTMGLDHSKINALLKVRSELPLGQSIPNLKLDYQQLKDQLSAENAKLVGISKEDALNQRVEDLGKSIESISRSVQQALSLAELLKRRQTSTLGQLLDLHHSAETYQQAKVDLEDTTSWHDEEMKVAAEFIRDQGGTFYSTFEWLDRFQTTYGDRLLTPSLDRYGARELSSLLCTLSKRAWTVCEQWSEIRTRIAGTSPCNDAWLSPFRDGVPRIDLQAVLETLHKEESRLPAWIAFCRTLERCRRAGVETFAMAAARDEINESQLSDCYRVTIFNQIAENELSENDIGFTFTAREIQDIRSNFQKFDRQSMTAKSIEIAKVARLRGAPEGNGRGRVAEFTEMALIRHEISKKTRHCKIRDLMTRAGSAIQALKPCFLMSPLSLARYIPYDTLNFDLVIMDEASQIKPEDAIGAILRAKQLVVVGDPKQLPPTSFFDQTEEEIGDEEATQFDNAESVLEVAQRSFQPFRRLRWHYRSQHESLIHFSNSSFYDEDLVVFPSPQGVMGGYGIVAHYIEGASCKQGENLKEAEQVVARILHHATNHPYESLGVAAFNRKQAEMIEELLDKACDADPEMAKAIARMREGDDGLFIKNLESIQGDERDVIFISYTYGPDPVSGKVLQRFGPINSDLGWRRLNVMVTRSRKRMEVFSSMQPSQVHHGPDKSRGVNAYHDFLEFAFTGAMRSVGSDSGREPGSPFEESVARVVMSLGFEPVFQVGVAGFFIDVGVRRRDGNKDFLLGIECDGATYHSSKSARDRDRLREEVITSRGWKIHRIWSTEWFLNQKAEEERLKKVLQAAL